MRRAAAFVRSNWPALTLALIGAALIAVGVARGEYAVVLRKAVRICMECIGLG